MFTIQGPPHLQLLGQALHQLGDVALVQSRAAAWAGAEHGEAPLLQLRDDKLPHARPAREVLAAAAGRGRGAAWGGARVRRRRQRPGTDDHLPHRATLEADDARRL